MNNKKNATIIVTVIVIMILMVTLVVGLVSSVKNKVGNRVKRNADGTYDRNLDQLMDDISIDINEAELVKGKVELGNTTLYDELPEIDKYPLAVESKKKDINLEIFTSGEKAGKNTDAWLIDVANAFNSNNITTSDGKTVGVSVRSVSSGLAADYISSGKYIPDMYSPSNTLFGDYAISNGADMSLYNERLVGNTAGILIKKNSEYNTFEKIVEAVKAGKINLGYTNPQTSASGLNFLITMLKSEGAGDVSSTDAAAAFSSFNDNIPYVAYTTQQMRDSAKNGSLDGMVMEYQAYINDEDLKSIYDFIPYGMRHDNPLFVTAEGLEKGEEAIKLFNDFCMSKEMQDIATSYGFNSQEDYTSNITATGAEVTKSLEVYKKNKDSGKDVIAVFVADCSGSMSGDAINQLKESLSNGANYINENNYIGLVSYSSHVTVELPIAQFDFNQHSYFEGAVDRLDANGATYTYEALCVATDMIKKAKADNPNAKTMIFLLSDGQANGEFSLNYVENMIREEGIPIYTISYTNEADTEAMKAISSINEAATINADSDDVIYKIKSLFNSQM